MDSAMKEFEHLVVKLEEVKSATDNFNDTKIIGKGGFGYVYEGEVSQPRGKTKAAFKRLDRKHGQGDPHFWKEVMMLSRYTHENLISLLGYCNEGGEMILVYEHASNGSLDRHLCSTTLSWTQRIRICHDAAKGLCYLHEDKGDPHFWKEVMMLSRYTHENLISLLGYCNEGGEMILVYEHASNGSLDRHLCSTTLSWTQRIRICHDAAKGLCYLHEDKGNHRVLHRDIKSSNILLDENWKAKVSDMGLAKVGPANQFTFLITDNVVGTFGYVDPMYLRTGFLTKESDVYSFGVVLFEVLCGRLCFDYSGNIVHIWKQRYEENKLDEIVFKDDLVQALDQSSLEVFSEIAFQCLQESREKRPKMSHVVEKLEIALISQEYQEIVKAVVPPLIYKSIEELKVLLSNGVLLNGGKTWLSVNEKGEHIERIYMEACNPQTLFPGGLCYFYHDRFKASVRGEYLTPHISYTANLVFRYRWQSDVNYHNPLRYKIDGEDETKVFIIYPTIHEREDGWFVVPLYHFTSQHTTADLQFEFEYRWVDLLVAGIEFQPSEEKVELPVFEEYQHIVEAASQSLFYTSLDQLKQILSKGIYLKDYKTWFSLNEKGEHCHLISMEDCLIPNEDSTPRYESHGWSRFPAGLYQTNKKGFKTHVKTQFLSPSITYTVNLIYYSSFDEKLKYILRGETTTSTVNLANQREVDDLLWMVELFQFSTSDGSIVDLEITFGNHGSNLQLEGILFQPLEKMSYLDENGKKCFMSDICLNFIGVRSMLEDDKWSYHDKNEKKFAISEIGLLNSESRFPVSFLENDLCLISSIYLIYSLICNHPENILLTSV
ncbi:protein kinase-like domain, Phloem protein 2-like protein [Artemisia annua]|uniref:Protein kinase-like domain, Phloem protein 2-like protein n=1 Tax=Artemisia annua TaxID=35608 RepID=A0A2U1KT08_ARTAN|nr:protein kinase-like domain, Phloem protein 2-like protein [Artemisia annua]